MAYNIKDVFYLSTSTQIDKTTSNGGSAQLDLSAYIDPIARGRQKGTGLAVYKVHWSIMDDSNSGPIDDAETGTLSFGLVAGAGTGDLATGAFVPSATLFSFTNSLLVASGQFYGPKSNVANACTTVSMHEAGMTPSTEVPYVIVRDNVCMNYMVGDQFVDDTILSIRLEVAPITLDQATLNQLLRTQTV